LSEALHTGFREIDRVANARVVPISLGVLAGPEPPSFDRFLG